MRAVILAGGKGTRLRPYTTVLPKPLVPVADRPILELIIRQLAAAGFTRIDLCVGHLGGLIKAYFDRIELPEGLELRYCLGGRAAGHGGGAEPDRGPRRALPGDERRHAHHARLRPADALPPRRTAPLTIATHRQEVGIDLGVIESERRRGHRLRREADNALRRQHGHLRLRPRGARVDSRRAASTSPTWSALLDANRKVTLHGPGVWFDIGTVGEHERATAEIEAHPELFEDA